MPPKKPAYSFFDDPRPTASTRPLPSVPPRPLFSRGGLILIGVVLVLGIGLLVNFRHQADGWARLSARIGCANLEMEHGRRLMLIRLSLIEAGAYRGAAGQLREIKDRMDEVARERRQEECLRRASGA